MAKEPEPNEQQQAKDCLLALVLNDQNKVMDFQIIEDSQIGGIRGGYPTRRVAFVNAKVYPPVAK